MVKCQILQIGYNMNKILDKILTEWAYRVHDGMPNPKNLLHLVQLEESLNELKLPRKVSEKLLQNLRELCTKHESLLIFDEVMTGFRIARGGAAEYYSVTPDLFTFGKIMGGGLPIGAYGGKKEWMKHYH